MDSKLWTVARFPNGSWSTGGRPDSPDYAECVVYRVNAVGEKDAKKKGQAMHRKAVSLAQKQASGRVE